VLLPDPGRPSSRNPALRRDRARHLYRSEFERALELADDLGLRRLDERSHAAVTRLAAP
jgi:hypothetical protein